MSPLAVDIAVLLLQACAPNDLIMRSCSVEHCCDVLQQKNGTQIAVSEAEGQAKAASIGAFFVAMSVKPHCKCSATYISFAGSFFLSLLS